MENKKLGYWYILGNINTSILTSYMVFASAFSMYMIWRLDKADKFEKNKGVLSYDSSHVASVPDVSASVIDIITTGFSVAAFGALFMIPVIIVLSAVIYTPLTKVLLKKTIINSALRSILWGGFCSSFTFLLLGLNNNYELNFDVIYFLAGCFAGFIFYQLIKKMLIKNDQEI